MRRFSANFLLRLFFAAFAQLASAAAEEHAPTLAEAGHLSLTGKYAEAAEAYQALLADEPVAAAIGLARCQGSRGDHEAAERTLSTANQAHPKAAVLNAERAALAYERGDYKAAGEHVAAALKTRPDSLAARWWQAELYRAAGKLDEAQAAYKWFVDYYNQHDEFTPDDLRWIGRAATQFARWRRLSSQFSFIVNDLYPDALKLASDYWPAHYESGMLFLEKYNDAQAMRELKAALAINPNAAEAHAALAAVALHNFQLDEARRELDRAAEINPKLLAIGQLRGDLHIISVEVDGAIAALEAVRELNPVDEETLGRLAAAYAVADGISPGKELSPRVARIIEEVDGRNPHAGTFYYTLGAALDLARRFPAAAQYYREAVARMPELTLPRGALGLMYLRLGEEAEAKRLLDESFDIDPFNVRVANSVKVLEVLDGYAVLETDHFVLKFDRGQDELLARYASRYLEEEVYPALVARFGFEPDGKSLFEIFSRARNSDAHTWFSARMVGLPFVSTVGACAGKVVALTSPRELSKKFNWARVLKHEFVHVLNLQQTDFNVPHWFTEALAVETEGYARPPEWNRLLKERVPKGELFNLDSINLGFVRPASSHDWQMAYCQAQLYAQYMLQTYGDDALSKMLAAYAENLDTRGALRRSFDVDQQAFETGYLEYLHGEVAELTPPQAEDRLTIEDAQSKVVEAGDDAAKLRQLTGKIAEAATAEPHDVRWPKLLARVCLKSGDDARLAQALKVLAHIDPDNALVRKKLAQLALTAQDFSQAEEWAKAACQTDLWDGEGHRFWGLALVGQEQLAAAMKEFEVAIQLDPDDKEAKDAMVNARKLAERGNLRRTPNSE